MDIVSHGLWGAAAFGRPRKTSFWLAFVFGVAPDLFSFGIFSLSVWLGLASGPDWGAGLPDPSEIPRYVHTLYDWTHSLLVFAWVFSLVWIIIRRPLWEMSAWGLHIIMDIFTHSSRFFPTPFLWPVSERTVDSISWGDPRIFIPNIILLVIVYGWFLIRARRSRSLVA